MLKSAPLALWLALMTCTLAGAGELTDIVAVLHLWERTSEGVPAPLADVAFAEYCDSHNAHELELAAELFGAVDARRLIEDFAWSGSVEGERVVLHAVPRDEVTRLFCAGIDIELGARTVLPMQIRFHDSETGPRKTALARPAGLEPAVTRTASRPVHTASLIQWASGLSVADRDADSAPELTQVLDRWAAATRGIDRAELRFVRFHYDGVYFIEQRCRGRFRFQAPGAGCYELLPADEESEPTSKRKGPHGESYTVTTAPPVTYYWNDGELMLIHPKDRVLEVFDIPEELDSEIRTVGSWDRIWVGLADPQRLLPGVVDVHSRDFLDDFAWSLLNRTDERITLKGVPRTGDGSFEFSELQVILDACTYRTEATRVISPSGSTETVHVFNRADYNGDIGSPEEWLPDLSEFTDSNPAPPAPAAEPEA